MKQFIEKIKNKENLSFEESKAAFELLMEGKAEDQEIFDFLTLLSTKGEAANEILDLNNFTADFISNSVSCNGDCDGTATWDACGNCVGGLT